MQITKTSYKVWTICDIYAVVAWFDLESLLNGQPN